MCHEWWLRRRAEEREVGRRYGVSSGTRPLSNPEVIEEEAEVTLEKREPTPLAAQQ